MTKALLSHSRIPAILTLLISLASAASAQQDISVSELEKTNLIEAILKRLNDSYVLPAVAQQMERSVRARMQRREYEQIKSGSALAEALTTHLREVSKDKHLGIRFSYDPIPIEGTRAEPSLEERERFRRMVGSMNFGFEKVEKLGGNIGYMELNGFINAEIGGDTAVAAMQFLINTDALIIDLRYNGGGVPGLNQLISTYFFERPVHLTSVHWRENNRVEQFWTLPYVPGKRYIDKPVYILLAKGTLSAPESLAYSLQALKRATIVGETSAGGANPFREFRINEHFAIHVPVGQAVNPVTGTNWEGKGVVPDIKVPAAQALKAAQLDALKKLLDSATSERAKTQLRSAIADLEKQP